MLKHLVEAGHRIQVQVVALEGLTHDLFLAQFLQLIFTLQHTHKTILIIILVPFMALDFFGVDLRVCLPGHGAATRLRSGFCSLLRSELFVLAADD